MTVTPIIIPHHKDISHHKSIHAHLSVGCEEWETLVEPRLPRNPNPRPDIHVLREIALQHSKSKAASGKSAPPPTEGVDFSERLIPANESEITIRIYKPSSSSPDETFPLLCYMHGGGYAMGNLDSSDYLCRTACVSNRVVCVNVGYRLSPEFPFPTGVMDSYDAFKWAIRHADELKVDTRKGLIIGGTSSGANYAAAITFLAQDEDLFKQHPITGQILSIPTVCAQEAYPEQYASELSSRWDLKDAPFLDEHAIEQFRTLYVPPSGPTPFDIRVSQVIAPSHKGLPSTYFQVAGKDPLRDEGLLYEKLLRESGVKTKLDVYPGVPHGFASFMPELKVSRKYRDDVAHGLDWLLGTS